MTSNKKPEMPADMSFGPGEENDLASRVNRLATISPFIADCFCLLETNPEGILITAFHFRNGSFLGHAVPESSKNGSWLLENVATGDQPALQNVIHKVLKGNTAISDIQIKSLDGAERLCRVTAKPVWDQSETRVRAGLLAFEEIAFGVSEEVASSRTPTIIDSVLNNYVMVDENGLVVASSGQAKKLLGISLDEKLAGRNFLDFFAESERDFPVIGNLDYREFAMKLACHDGGERWLRVCSYPVEKSSSTLGTNFIVLGDITTAKLAQIELSDSEEKFRALSENSPGVIFLEVGQKIVYVNSRCEELLGYTPTEMMDSEFDLRNLFDVASSAEIKKELIDKLATEPKARLQREMRILRKDGQGRNCILSIQCMPYRGRKACLGIFTDITDLHLANRKLSETRKRYWALFEAAADAIFVETLDGTIIDCNSAAENSYGYSKAELMGMNARELVPGDFSDSMQGIADSLCAPDNAGKTIHIVATGRRKDGTIFPSEVAISELKLGAEDLFLVTVKDISYRREIEVARQRYDNQLQQIQLLDSFGIVVNGLANDFNNLLTGIMGYADLILRDLSPTSPVREKAKKIVSASRRGGEIIQQLISSTGKLPAHFQNGKVTTAIREIIPDLTELVKDKGILACFIDEDLPQIMFDSNQIKVAVENLLRNAVEAIDGSEGRLGLAVFRGLERYCGSEVGYFGPPMNAGNYLAIKVTDDGSGIPAESLSKIFEPFYSTRYSNRGLGLASVLGTVRSHRGAILVHSVVGKGSEFTLMLPCQTDGVREEEFLTHQADEVFPAGSVLIVDDDVGVSEVLGDQLQTLGYEIFKAFDGVQGIELFKRLNRRLDLVVLDLSMPGKSGMEVLKELRWLNPEIPVIICTGMHEISEDLSKYGVSTVLNKPFHLVDVEKALLKVHIS